MEFLKRLFTSEESASEKGPVGKMIRSFGKEGAKKGMFNSPTGIAVTKNGQIVVVDTENHRVQIFDAHGKPKVMFGGHGSKPDQFNIPMCVTLTRDQPQKIMITDSVNAKIKVYTLEGVFDKEVGDENVLAFPCGIGTFRDGIIVISDVCLHAIIIMDDDGDMIRSFGSYGSLPSQLDHPYYLCISSNDNIIVSDSGNSAVKIFSSVGDILHNFSLSDFKLHREDYVILQGIACDEDDNVMLIGNNTVYMVASNGRLWEAVVPSDGLHAPVCLCSMNSEFILVTQRGTSLNHEVSIFHYDKSIYIPLRTAHLVKASTTGKVTLNKPKRIKVDLPLRKPEGFSLAAKAESHFKKRTFSAKPVLATVMENVEFPSESCGTRLSTVMEVEDENMYTEADRLLPKAKSSKHKVKHIRIPDSINSHVITG